MTYRIQKLLFSDYTDLEDTVLVESPFAETTREGVGVRQVQIGLTPSKFIVATYRVRPADGPDGLPRPSVDPDIDSFELVLAYPVDTVNLTVFRHRRRQTVRAAFSNGHVAFYEIGGWGERAMVWKLWCERLRFLAPYDEPRTSASEASVGSSGLSLAPSLHIARSSLTFSDTGMPTLWCHYTMSQSTQRSTWSDPHLYLGSSFTEKGINFMCFPDVGKKMSQRVIQEAVNLKKASMKGFPELSEEMEAVARQAVDLWVAHSTVHRPRRTYGIWPFPGLHSGLGVWSVTRAQAHTLQATRCASDVTLRDALDLPRVPANLLRTASLERLPVPALEPDQLTRLADRERTREVRVKFTMRDPGVNLEWTRKKYKRQLRHLSILRLKSPTYASWTNARKKTSWTRMKNSKIFADTDYRQSSSETVASTSSICSQRKNRSILTAKDSSTAENFKTSSLANQLTMIDKQLFQSLNLLELGRLLKDGNSKRAPNWTKLVAFSHRISCLVASQITSEANLKARAAQVVRWTGVAYKCHRLRNMQSAESVLRGLQSPAVYRLANTWAYVRRRHASKYRRFEDLCRRYGDERQPLYLREYARCRAALPNLPPATVLVAALARRLPALPPATTPAFTSESCQSLASVTMAQGHQARKEMRKRVLPKPVRKLLSSLNMYEEEPNMQCDTCRCASNCHLHALDTATLETHLDAFFAPVKGGSPSTRALEDAGFLLKTHRPAVARYASPVNQPARDCLLLASTPGLGRLLQASRRLEPPDGDMEAHTGS